MTNLLAIDPGNVESGWVLMDEETYEPLEFGKTDNYILLDRMFHDYRDSKEPTSLLEYDNVIIERVASYGMGVGASVFETCEWVGRFFQQALHHTGNEPEMMYRQVVRLHHCMSPKANDSTVKQALVDRFAKNATNYGKGTKKDPGFFYGFAKDIWQAYALGVCYLDIRTGSHANLRGED